MLRVVFVMFFGESVPYTVKNIPAHLPVVPVELRPKLIMAFFFHPLLELLPGHFVSFLKLPVVWGSGLNSIIGQVDESVESVHGERFGGGANVPFLINIPPYFLVYVGDQQIHADIEFALEV